MLLSCETVNEQGWLTSQLELLLPELELLLHLALLFDGLLTLGLQELGALLLFELLLMLCMLLHLLKRRQGFGLERIAIGDSGLLLLLLVCMLINRKRSVISKLTIPLFEVKLFAHFSIFKGINPPRVTYSSCQTCGPSSCVRAPCEGSYTSS